MADHGPVSAAVGTLALVDHHVHQALGSDVPRAAFEGQITESDRPAPPGTTQFDSQLGFAIRRWCAPVLGLAPSAPAEEYLARRAELGPERATGLLLRATGVACFLIDTGYVLDTMLSLPEMAAAAGAGRVRSSGWNRLPSRSSPPGTGPRPGSPAVTATRCGTGHGMRSAQKASWPTGTGWTSTPTRPRPRR